MKLKTAALNTKKYKSRLTLIQGRHLSQDEIMYIATGVMLFFAVLLFAGWEAFAAAMQYIAGVGFFVGLFVAFFQIDTEDEQMKKFAKANKMKFVAPPGSEYFPPRLKDASARFIEYLFEGKLSQGEVFRLMNIGHIKKHEDMHDYWVLHVELAGVLPEFIIDAWYNSLMIDRKSKQYHEVKLEGDFSDYFGLYLPKGSHIDVLSVMSPDVMEAMMEFWNDTDIFVKENNLWLLTFRTNDKKDVQALFDAAEVIVPELNHRARTYQA